MVKQLRIDHFNQWLEVQDFKAEIYFKNRLNKFHLSELFFPYQIGALLSIWLQLHVVVAILQAQ